MAKLPYISAAVVGAAVLTMVGLGVWQLQRWTIYQANRARLEQSRADTPIAFPKKVDAATAEQYLFQSASGYCAAVTSWAATGGANTHGDSGWRHLATCFTGEADADPMVVDIGWNKSPENPKWAGGQVSGVISQGGDGVLRLISTEAAPGLEPSAKPDMDNLPHHNSLSYAIQWFSFAFIALVISLLAWRRGQR